VRPVYLLQPQMQDTLPVREQFQFPFQPEVPLHATRPVAAPPTASTRGACISVVFYKLQPKFGVASSGHPAAIGRAHDKETIPMTFRKGESGNPLGRPRGARNKLALLAESLLEGDAAALVSKLIEVAKSGNVGALRLCIDRICPPQRDRTVAIELPPMTTAADAVAGMGVILQAIGEGDLGAREAGELANVVTGFSQTIATTQLEKRLDQIEKAMEVVKPE
jgi:hypothetical protein